MQIVIDIDDKVYGLLKYFEKGMGLNNKKDDSDDVKTALMRAVANGTPLPKGHGRIADMDAAIKCIEDVEGDDAVWAISLIEWACSKRTIIEADIK